MPWYLGNSYAMNMGFFRWGMIPLAIWSVFWMGLALWHAAKRNDKWWFVLFLLVHTMGILEMIYLLFVVRAFSDKKKARRSK